MKNHMKSLGWGGQRLINPENNSKRIGASARYCHGCTKTMLPSGNMKSRLINRGKKTNRKAKKIFRKVKKNKKIYRKVKKNMW